MHRLPRIGCQRNGTQLRVVVINVVEISSIRVGLPAIGGDGDEHSSDVLHPHLQPFGFRLGYADGRQHHVIICGVAYHNVVHRLMVAVFIFTAITVVAGQTVPVADFPADGVGGIGVHRHKLLFPGEGADGVAVEYAEARLERQSAVGVAHRDGQRLRSCEGVDNRQYRI